MRIIRDRILTTSQREYGDCRPNKRLYFGGHYPWEMGNECLVVLPDGHLDYGNLSGVAYYQDYGDLNAATVYFDYGAVA